ncbi:unnamed protein product [Rotaria sordida]|uniref:TLC domain-containing protein n=1 Tax=Rotaria sordida TaxID=392033 RepID=A0A818T3K3_9BILA|nr:unnamed protein product [Rotaria sordida]
MLRINATLGIVYTILSFGFFVVCRYIVRPLTLIRPMNKRNEIIRKKSIRTWFTYSNEQEWKRSNLLISLLHSLITSILVCFSFWIYLPSIYDFVNHLSLVTYVTCSFSFRYFWYDLFDIISNKQESQFWELILHHILFNSDEIV